MSFFQSAIEDFRKNQYQYGQTRVRNISQTTSERIFPILEQNNINKDDLVLVVTGSDWRKENRTDASSIEMIAYVDYESCSKDVIQKITRELWSAFMGYNRLSIAKKVYGTNKVEVEPKLFKEISYFEDPYSDYTSLFPTRFIDWAMIYGTEEIHKKLFTIFATELKGMNAKALKPFKSRITYAKDVSNQWERRYKNNNIEHFNRDKKEIYYQKTPELETGVKMWPLRYIQYKLSYLLTNIIAENKVAYEDFKEIGGFIHNKIEFLRNFIKGWIDESQIQEISYIYYTFLKIHHICQKEYKNIEGVYIYYLKEDEEKILREMLLKLNGILSQLTIW